VSVPDAAALERQEALFARAYAAGDLALARPLYHPELVYVSPTVRLFERRGPIHGLDAALDFIELTIRDCANVAYRAVERAPLPADSAFARIHFDWDAGPARWRSSYVVLYRYRAGLIARQELYYDPSGELERLGPRAGT
jgi:hypothetical protein